MVTSEDSKHQVSQHNIPGNRSSQITVKYVVNLVVPAMRLGQDPCTRDHRKFVEQCLIDSQRPTVTNNAAEEASFKLSRTCEECYRQGAGSKIKGRDGARRLSCLDRQTVRSFRRFGRLLTFNNAARFISKRSPDPAYFGDP